MTIDDIIIEAITSGMSPASLKARELCAEAAQRKKDELMMMEEQESNVAPLSEQPVSSLPVPSKWHTRIVYGVEDVF